MYIRLNLMPLSVHSFDQKNSQFKFLTQMYIKSFLYKISIKVS